MADVVLAPFVSGEIDAAAEMGALGLNVAEHFLLRLSEVAASAPPRADDFGTYRTPTWRTPIPVYKLEHARCFVIFVVDLDGEEYRLTVLHAGRIEEYYRVLPAPGWHRQAAPIVEPRLKELFA